MSGIMYLNGIDALGLVASTSRTVKDGREYEKYFNAPKRQDKFLSYAGTTTDTIQFMSDIIKNTLNETKRIAPLLKRPTLDLTLNAIFEFVFDHISYKPDSPQNEELRSPSRTFAERASGVDCDCYSIFIGSILSNLNIPFALRMVKINGKPHYQHVYIVVPKDGKKSSLEHNYYTVDPVLDTYNEEHPFTEKYEIFMQPIKYLNGVPSATLSGLASVPLDNIYYSPEAANTPEDVIFFDGTDHYERVNGLGGLGGLHGLGFLSKIWKGVKAVGKVVKKIGKKAIKKIKFKKNGQKRKIFMNKSEKAALAASETAAAPTATTSASTTAQTSTNLTKDIIDVANAVTNNTTVDQVMSIAKAIAPDSSLLNEITDAKIKANAGISDFEARLMVNDAAKAQVAEAKAEAAKDKAEILETVYSMNSSNTQNASFMGNMSPMTLLFGAGILSVGVAMLMRRPVAQAA